MEQSIMCVLVGDIGVGKTSLINAYSTGASPGSFVSPKDHYCPTLIYVDNIPIRLDLCDTAAFDVYEPLRAMVYPNAHAILICFELVNQSSFDNVKNKWLPELSRHCPHTPIILVGTKLDLREDRETTVMMQEKGLNTIQYSQGLQLANQIGAAKYIECSSLTQQGLQSVVEDAIRIVLKGNQKSSRRRKKMCALL